MRESVDRNMVSIIANMLTDDPDLLNEAPVTHHHSGSGTRTLDEVNLTPELPPDRAVLGSVTYRYGVNMSPASSRTAPGAQPDEHSLGLGDVEVVEMHAYGPDGNEIRLTPQLFQQFEKAAVDYFLREKADNTIEREYQNVQPVDRYDFQ